METLLQKRYESYPRDVQEKIQALRALVLSVAKDENLGPVTETLKWGEPSFLTPHGSTLRMDWKEKQPEVISLFFNCQSLLVETFRELFGEQLICIGSREVKLPLSKELSTEILRIIIATTLNYHKIKKLPLLGL